MVNGEGNGMEKENGQEKEKQLEKEVEKRVEVKGEVEIHIVSYSFPQLVELAPHLFLPMIRNVPPPSRGSFPSLILIFDM